MYTMREAAGERANSCSRALLTPVVLIDACDHWLLAAHMDWPSASASRTAGRQPEGRCRLHAEALPCHASLRAARASSQFTSAQKESTSASSRGRRRRRPSATRSCSASSCGRAAQSDAIAPLPTTHVGAVAAAAVESDRAASLAKQYEDRTNADSQAAKEAQEALGALEAAYQKAQREARMLYGEVKILGNISSRIFNFPGLDNEIATVVSQ